MRVLSLVCVFFPLRFSVLHLIFCVLKYIHNKIFAINLFALFIGTASQTLSCI